MTSEAMTAEQIDKLEKLLREPAADMLGSCLAIRDARALLATIRILQQRAANAEQRVRELEAEDEREGEAWRVAIESLGGEIDPADPRGWKPKPAVCNCNNDGDEPPGGWQGASKPLCPVHDGEEADD